MPPRGHKWPKNDCRIGRVAQGVPRSLLYYPVLSWSKTRIVAADSPTGPLPICNWSEITVNFADKTVGLTDHRKLGKGHEGLNNVCLELPLTENYHLIDEVSERIRRLRRGGSKKNKK